MNFKKIFITGLIAGIAAFLVGNLLYLNPLTASLYSISSSSYCAKSMELFGGVMPWLGLMGLMGILSTILLAILYSFTEQSLSGKAWKKGLFFGFLFWLVSTLPNAYNTWLLHSYPDVTILIELFNSLIGSLVAGIVIAIVYSKLK